MKKKFFIGIAMSLFAVATVFNMNISEQRHIADISIEDIAVMAKADGESFGCPNGCLTTAGCCYCYGFHDKYEYIW